MGGRESLRCERDANMPAVAAEPAAAETPAMMANVVLDMAKIQIEREVRNERRKENDST